MKESKTEETCTEYYIEEYEELNEALWQNKMDDYNSTMNNTEYLVDWFWRIQNKILTQLPQKRF
jgi:hypothetical protein